MNLQTLSSFALARMLSDCAQGSAMQRQIQDELLSRVGSVEHADSKTPWLFSDEELKAMRKKWGRRPAEDLVASHDPLRTKPCCSAFLH